MEGLPVIHSENKHDEAPQYLSVVDGSTVAGGTCLNQVILVKTVNLINRAARGSKTFRLDRMVNSFVFWRVPFSRG